MPLIHKNLPKYFDTFSIMGHDIHNHYTRNRNRIHSTLIKHEFNKRCIGYSIRQVINNLPQNIESKLYTQSLKSCSNHVKTFMINNYESTCDIIHCYICQTMISLRRLSYAMLHILGYKQIYNLCIYFPFIGPNLSLMFSYWYDCMNCMYKCIDLSVLLSFELKCAFIRILKVKRKAKCT